MEEHLNEPPPLIRVCSDRSGRREQLSQVQCHHTKGGKKVNPCAKNNCSVYENGTIIYLSEFGRHSAVQAIVNVFQLKAFLCTHSNIL